MDIAKEFPPCTAATDMGERECPCLNLSPQALFLNPNWDSQMIKMMT
jgi:hypothetical protein